jgi:predicted TIM-barrel fold metal-dependent hydrolase
MGRLEPTRPDARQRLEHWLDEPGMVALRFGIPIEPWLSWLRDGLLEWCWPIAERQGIPTSIYAPSLTDRIASVAERFPGLPLIVDHLNLPLETGPEAFSGLDDVLALARFPNVYVKVSALTLYTREPFPFRDLEPHIRRVYDVYGPQRMMWGSDLSRLKGPYRESVGLFREGCDFLSPEDRAWILGRTAAKLLRWGDEEGGEKE